MSQSQEAGTQQGPSKAELQKYLEMRALKKAKTPEFQRQESWRYVRIHDPWRKPKGVDSHMRLSIKGWPALVKIGYRGPSEARGLHPSGYRDVLVHNKSELEALSKDYDAARLAATVGRRKKIELAIRAKELGIRVLNGRGLLPSEVKAPAGEEEEEKEVKTEEAAAQETGTSAQPTEEQQEEEQQEEEEEPQPTEESASVAETEEGPSATPEEPSEIVAIEQAKEQQGAKTEPSQKPRPKKASKAKKKSTKKTSTKKASTAKSKKKQSKKKKSKDGD